MRENSLGVLGSLSSSRNRARSPAADPLRAHPPAFRETLTFFPTWLVKGGRGLNRIKKEILEVSPDFLLLAATGATPPISGLRLLAPLERKRFPRSN
jgi:hypothetical protein